MALGKNSRLKGFHSYIDKDEHDELKKISKVQRRSISDITREAISIYIAENKDKGRRKKILNLND